MPEVHFHIAMRWLPSWSWFCADFWKGFECVLGRAQFQIPLSLTSAHWPPLTDLRFLLIFTVNEPCLLMSKAVCFCSTVCPRDVPFDILAKSLKGNPGLVHPFSDCEMNDTSHWPLEQFYVFLIPEWPFNGRFVEENKLMRLGEDTLTKR